MSFLINTSRRIWIFMWLFYFYPLLKRERNYSAPWPILIQRNTRISHQFKSFFHNTIALQWHQLWRTNNVMHDDNTIELLSLVHGSLFFSSNWFDFICWTLHRSQYWLYKVLKSRSLSQASINALNAYLAMQAPLSLLFDKISYLA